MNLLAKLSTSLLLLLWLRLLLLLPLYLVVVNKCSYMGLLKSKIKFLWVGERVCVVCKVIFLSNPTSVEVELGLWQLVKILEIMPCLNKKIISLFTWKSKFVPPQNLVETKIVNQFLHTCSVMYWLLSYAVFVII